MSEIDRAIDRRARGVSYCHACHREVAYERWDDHVRGLSHSNRANAQNDRVCADRRRRGVETFYIFCVRASRHREGERCAVCGGVRSTAQ